LEKVNVGDVGFVESVEFVRSAENVKSVQLNTLHCHCMDSTGKTPLSPS